MDNNINTVILRDELNRDCLAQTGCRMRLKTDADESVKLCTQSF